MMRRLRYALRCVVSNPRESFTEIGALFAAAAGIYGVALGGFAVLQADEPDWLRHQRPPTTAEARFGVMVIRPQGEDAPDVAWLQEVFRTRRDCVAAQREQARTWAPAGGTRFECWEDDRK